MFIELEDLNGIKYCVNFAMVKSFVPDDKERETVTVIVFPHPEVALKLRIGYGELAAMVFPERGTGAIAEFDKRPESPLRQDQRSGSIKRRIQNPLPYREAGGPPVGDKAEEDEDENTVFTY